MNTFFARSTPIFARIVRVALLAIIGLSVAALIARAAPPGANLPLPLTTSATAQTKVGGLAVSADQVPIMTAQTTEGVTVTQSQGASALADRAAWRLFDGNLGQGAESLIIQNPTGLIQVYTAFPKPTMVSSYTLIPRIIDGMYYMPSEFQLYGTNDAINWTLLNSQSGLTTGWINATPRSFSIASPAAYMGYALNITGFLNSGWLMIGEMELLQGSGTFTIGTSPKVDIVSGGIVAGQGITTAAFRLTTGAGAGKVLTSDANGVASWKSTGPDITVVYFNPPTTQGIKDVLVPTNSWGQQTLAWLGANGDGFWSNVHHPGTLDKLCQLTSAKSAELTGGAPTSYFYAASQRDWSSSHDAWACETGTCVRVSGSASTHLDDTTTPTGRNWSMACSSAASPFPANAVVRMVYLP